MMEGAKECKINELWLRISSGLFLNIKYIDKIHHLLKDPSIFILDKNFNLKEKVNAKIGKIKRNKWYLKDGIKIVYGNN